MTRIWALEADKAAGSLPPIIPVVLYHGSAKWNVALNFAALYKAPGSLLDGLWDFNYYLCDLSSYADEENKLCAIGRLGLLLMKHVRSPDLVGKLTFLTGLLRGVNQQTALEFLETVLRYLSEGAPTLKGADFRKAISAALPEPGDVNMNRLLEEIADDLVAERKGVWIHEARMAGIAEGKRAGIAEGKRAGIVSFTIRLLIRKFGDLDASLEDRVRQLSQEELEKLGDDLLDMPNEAAIGEWLDRTQRSH
jgi:hypothetical protein